MIEDLRLRTLIPPQYVARVREHASKCWFCAPSGFDIKDHRSFGLYRDTRRCPHADKMIEALLGTYSFGAWRVP